MRFGSLCTSRMIHELRELRRSTLIWQFHQHLQTEVLSWIQTHLPLPQLKLQMQAVSVGARNLYCFYCYRIVKTLACAHWDGVFILLVCVIYRAPFLTGSVWWSPSAAFHIQLSLPYFTVQWIPVHYFLSSSLDAMMFQPSKYTVKEGVNDIVTVILKADPLTTCLRDFTVLVSTRDGSARSEFHT